MTVSYPASGRDVQGGIASLVGGVRIAAQADGGDDALAHAAFRFDLAEVDRVDSAPARGRARSHARRQHQRGGAVGHRERRIGACRRRAPA